MPDSSAKPDNRPGTWETLAAHGWRAQRRPGKRLLAGVTLDGPEGGSISLGAGDVVEVAGLPDLTAAIVARRTHLGLAADAIDDAAGLAARHTQKVEDSGRRAAEGGRKSPESAARVFLRGCDQGALSADARAVLEHHLRSGIRQTENPNLLRAQPRVPTWDTVALVVAAMGGRIKIEWGEPPRLTRTFMAPTLSHRVAHQTRPESR